MRTDSALKTQWKAIACDLDGTLIGYDHKVNERDLDALRRARSAGIHIALCTGRNSIESAGVIGALDLSGPGIFVNGAMVADMGTGKTIDSQLVSYEFANEAVDFFGSRGHAVLILTDDPESRMPAYFMTTHAEPHRGTTGWLLANRMHAEFVEEIPHHHRDRIVRVGIVTEVPEGKVINAELERRFSDRASSHSIHSPFYDCQVIEVFSRGTSKWSGIEHMAGAIGIGAEQVIAIGDDINDVAMLEGARLSFAMGSAAPHVRERAKRVTGKHSECGVAQVIESLLSGELG